MTDLREYLVAKQFLSRKDDSSFAELFRLLSPQLVTFFARRGHDVSIAEDLAQEVMFTVYQRADQLRNRMLFRAWLFKIARSAACRLLAKRRREVPTVNLADIPEIYVI